MTIQYKYSSTASPGVPLTMDNDRVRLYTLDVTSNAEEGSVATSSIVVDDPDGDFDIVGHRNFAIRETAVLSGQSYIFVGATAERKIKRGPSGRVGAGAEWEVSVVDLNTLFERRVMVGTDCNRPAETDVARLQWLISTTEANFIGDTRYFSTTGPVAMDAVDYRGQTLKSIIDDCAQQSGKDYFLTSFEDTGTANFPWGLASFFYDFRSSTVYASTIRLSNVSTDIDSTVTFGISVDDTVLTRDPSRVYSGVYMPYDGGNAYVTRASISNEFARRDAVSPSQNVKTSAKANARANRYLDDIDTEEDIITTSFIVPAASVNLLREGMLVDIRATHLPGYDEFTTMRVVNRNVKQVSEQVDQTYKITVELGLGQTTQPGTGHEVLWIQDLSYGSHSAVTSVQGSDDGVTWTTVIPDMSSGSEPGTDDLWEITNPAHQGFRYWSFLYDHAHPGGFLAAVSQKALRLIDGDGVDALGTLGDYNSSVGPPDIPWQMVEPVVQSGPIIPYTASSTRPRLNGCLNHVDFETGIGPISGVQGDYTADPPEDSSHYGTNSTVIGAQQVTARWVWDLGE